MPLATRSFLLSLACLLLLLSSCRRPADPDPSRFARAIEAHETSDREMPPPADAVVFVGSSSIGGWKLDDYFSGWPVLNRGFGGSQISDVNYYTERIVLKYTPRAIVFYAGENDIHAGKSPERVFKDYRTFVETVHAALPETVIFFLPLKPSPSRLHLWPQMQATNERIRAYAASDSLQVYVDTATPMLRPDGRPRPEIFVEDSLHMNATGYALWTRLLTPELQGLGIPIARVQEQEAGSLP